MVIAFDSSDLELRKLQIEPLEIQLCNISGLQSLPPDIKFVLEIVQVIIGEFLCCLGNNKVRKGLAYSIEWSAVPGHDIEHQSAQ